MSCRCLVYYYTETFFFIFRLVGCQLTVKWFKIITRALDSEISQVKELDLSYNNLPNATDKTHSNAQLLDSQSKLEALRLLEQT